MFLDHFHEVPGCCDLQLKLIIIHQSLFISHNFYSLAWQTLNSETCIHYQLSAGNGCYDARSNSKILINGTKGSSIFLEREDLLDERNISLYFNIAAYNEEGTYLRLELFRFNRESKP